MKLILLRHGESQWNLENRFTGWKDVSLSEEGVNEASIAAKAHNSYTQCIADNKPAKCNWVFNRLCD